MSYDHALLIALIVVLLLVVLYQGRPGKPAKHGFENGPHNAYTLLQKEIDAIRGFRATDAYNQTPFYELPGGLNRYVRAGASVHPEEIAEAEREDWYTSEPSAREGFNPEPARDAAAETMTHHATGPAIDYNAYVEDTMLDPRTRDNHRKWVEEMKPWSGVAMKVDTLDMSNYIDFTGLRRPSPVSVHNPISLTEVGPADLSGNMRFQFVY